MGSQQVKTSIVTAPHEEPGLVNSANFSANAISVLNYTSEVPPKAEKYQKSKTPTGLGAEPLNIVILGASFGGLSCAHHFLDYTIKNLRKATTAPNYRLVLVSPSTHIYWNIAAPRALVRPGLVKHEEAFLTIEPGFHRHRGHNFAIVQATATSLDPHARTIEIELIGDDAPRRMSQINKRASKHIAPNDLTVPDEKLQTIRYHALIMATGSSAHSELLSLHGEHKDTIRALDIHHQKFANARTIVICGGGCSGVEAAGQMATFLNHTSHFPVKRKSPNAKQIILISGGHRLLPQLNEKIGKQAEVQLTKLGVEIRHDIRVTQIHLDFDLTGQTKIDLDNDTSIVADVYIACTGVTPNSAYAPASMKDDRGYIINNKETMRCDTVGPRVYAIGDVASYSQNYVLDIYAAVPVLMHNLLNDLTAHELRLANPFGGNQPQIDAMEDEIYVQRELDSQLCPIKRFGGVGMLMDRVIPAPMVHGLKGHDYRVCKAKTVVYDGGNPYGIQKAIGNKYE